MLQNPSKLSSSAFNWNFHPSWRWLKNSHQLTPDSPACGVNINGKRPHNAVLDRKSPWGGTLDEIFTPPATISIHLHAIHWFSSNLETEIYRYSTNESQSSGASIFLYFLQLPARTSGSRSKIDSFIMPLLQPPNVLSPRPELKMNRFVWVLLISEYLLIEIPVIPFFNTLMLPTRSSSASELLCLRLFS